MFHCWLQWSKEPGKKNLCQVGLAAIPCKGSETLLLVGRVCGTHKTLLVWCLLHIGVKGSPMWPLPPHVLGMASQSFSSGSYHRHTLRTVYLLQLLYLRCLLCNRQDKGWEMLLALEQKHPRQGGEAQHLAPAACSQPSACLPHAPPQHGMLNAQLQASWKHGRASGRSQMSSSWAGLEIPEGHK